MNEQQCVMELQAEKDRLSKIISAELVKAQPGDFLIFRAEAETVTPEDLVSLRRYLGSHIPDSTGVKILIIAGDLELTSMSEEQLKQAGLVRVGGKEPDDLTQFLEQTDFDAAEKVAGEKADAPALPNGGEDDCEGCKI